MARRVSSEDVERFLVELMSKAEGGGGQRSQRLEVVIRLDGIGRRGRGPGLGLRQEGDVDDWGERTLGGVG